MQINKINNLSFGYNKRLNKKLYERLEKDSNTNITKALFEINQSCNTTEDTIRKLAKNYDKNEVYINILANYFKNAKTFLCAAVDRLYPELNYTKTETDTYENEVTKKGWLEFGPKHEDKDGPVIVSTGLKLEYRWLDDVCTNLADMTQEVMGFRGTDYIDNSIMDGLHDFENFYDNDDKEEEYNVSSKAPGGTSESLVQKFVPSSHSPKSIDEVVGLEKSVKDVKNFILYPLKNPEEAKKREEEYGIEIPHFIVFNGPPGCGKTMLAEAIAAESNADMYKIDLSSMGSIYANGTVINVANTFKEITKMAKNSEKPVLVFMDEMDSLLAKRTYDDYTPSEDNKVVNTLLQIITSAKDNNIILIGATNMYDSIDRAVKRRVDMNAYIGLPKEPEIQTLLERQLGKVEKGKKLSKDKEAIKEISKKLLGYSPANIINITKSAFKECFVENKEIEKEDILLALTSGTYEKINEKEYIPESMKEKSGIGFKS